MISESENESANLEVMEGRKPENEVIRPLLIDLLKRYKKRHGELCQIKMNREVKLAVLTKKPYYLCDEYLCIQGVNVTSSEKFATEYYAHTQKPHLHFNCHDELIYEPYDKKAPNPYHPAYHYKDFEEFKEKRATTNIAETCEEITIKDWSLAIVNISGSAFYAPVIIIYDKRSTNRRRSRTKPMQNVIFQKTLTQYLNYFRVRDIKNHEFEQPSINQSLCYHLKTHSFGRKAAKKLSNFIQLDTNKKIIKYNETLPRRYITFGNLQGTYKFMRPLIEKHLTKDQQLIKVEVIEDEVVEQKPSSEQSEGNSWLYDDLWSDGEPAENPDRQQFQMISQCSEEESSEQEDILHGLYTRQMGKKY